MLLRAIAVTLGFACVLTLLAIYVQDVGFEPEHLLWAFLLSLPLGASVLNGSLGGASRLEYPNATFGTVALWIAMVGPSLIAASRDPRMLLNYSDEAVLVGRGLFLLWCTAAVVAAGRAQQRTAQLVPNTLDVVALCTPIALGLGYQLLTGSFGYQRGTADESGAQPMALVLAMTIGLGTLMFLPGFLLLVSARAQSVAILWLARGGMVVSVLLTFLTGGRRGIVAVVCMGFVFARLTGARVRLSSTLAIIAAVPIGFLVVFAYRSALVTSDQSAGSFSDLTAVATNATAGLAAGDEGSAEAIDDFSENVHLRLDMGPQYFVVVDMWLADGATMAGTLLAGAIRAMPRYLVPDKNEIWADYNFEVALVRTGRLPDVDLAPTPWAQWLYEFGILGVIAGGSLYGLLLRLVERKMVTTQSTFVMAFWAYVVSWMGDAESTTDILFTAARAAATVACLGFALAFVLRNLPVRSPSAPLLD